MKLTISKIHYVHTHTHTEVVIESLSGLKTMKRIVIIGASGAGKSTLCNVLAGQFTSGTFTAALKMSFFIYREAA